MKKAFTLVEMLVVIGIIGILSAILIGSFAGGTDSAKAAHCLANMRNLAVAAQAQAMASGSYPLAGSVEKYVEISKAGRVMGEMHVTELPGWVSWNSSGTYQNPPESHSSSAGWFVSTYSDDKEAKEYCITNGSIWIATARNRSTYVCPVHARVCAKRRLEPYWSYVMSAGFSWDTSMATKTCNKWYKGIEYGTLARAEKYLMFAELPFLKIDGLQDPEFSGAAGIENDPTLQYDGNGGAGNEVIGFNHKIGKTTYAHLCFADAHVEKLAIPARGISRADAQDLTKWLCQGKDVSYNGRKYEELK